MLADDLLQYILFFISFEFKWTNTEETYPYIMHFSPWRIKIVCKIFPILKIILESVTPCYSSFDPLRSVAYTE